MHGPVGVIQLNSVVGTKLMGNNPKVNTFIEQNGMLSLLRPFFAQHTGVSSQFRTAETLCNAADIIMSKRLLASKYLLADAADFQ